MIDIVGIVYAVIVSAGGIVGYVKAGSVPSIVAGLVFGALIGVSAYLCSIDPPKPLFQIMVTLVLGGFMGFRWYKGGKFMPSGLICIISIGVIFYDLIMYFKYLPLFGTATKHDPVPSDEDVTPQP